MNSINTLMKKWERAAIVRSRPRRVLLEEDKWAGLLFPLERLPLCTHPIITGMGEQALRFIQIQNLYHYLQGIANIELDIINDSSYKLYKNYLGISFPEEMRVEALSVIVDESYHALVALDLINQVKEMTSVDMLDLPQETEASYALKKALSETPESLKELVRLVCVSLSEQALTTDLIDVINNENVFPTFYQVMKDHVADEGRHARFSQSVLEFIWVNSDFMTRKAMSKPISVFIESYASDIVSKQTDTAILQSLRVDSAVIDTILADTYPAKNINLWDASNIVIRQMLVALEKAGILGDLAAQRLQADTV